MGYNPNQVYQGGGGVGHPPCSFGHQAAKFGQNFTKLSAYDAIGLPSWLLPSVVMHVHACMHTALHINLCMRLFPPWELFPELVILKNGRNSFKNAQNNLAQSFSSVFGWFLWVCFLHFFDLMQYFSENSFSQFSEFPKLLTFQF